MAKRKIRPSKTKSPKKPVHPWRICPAGQYFRRGTVVSGYTTTSGKTVSSHPRRATCAHNPSGKDQLYPEEMKEIALRHFKKFKGTPLKTLPEFKKKGDRFDDLIQGWTRYWNEVLNPGEPLDPMLVKALIASESGFRPNAWNKLRGPKRARGLMQVTDKSLRLMTDDYAELSDHFLNLTEDDMLNPNYSICAGIRWLFRKKQIAEARVQRAVSWREAVAEFKGIKPSDGLMSAFDRYYAELTRKE